MRSWTRCCSPTRCGRILTNTTVMGIRPDRFPLTASVIEHEFAQAVEERTRQLSDPARVEERIDRKATLRAEVLYAARTQAAVPESYRPPRWERRRRTPRAAGSDRGLPRGG